MLQIIVKGHMTTATSKLSYNKTSQIKESRITKETFCYLYHFIIKMRYILLRENHEFPYNIKYSDIRLENSIKRKRECINHLLSLKMHSTLKSTGTMRSNMIKDFFIRKGDVW